PSYYLMTNRAALEARIDFYLNQLARAGVIPNAFAEGVRRVELQFLSRATAPVPYVERKATNAIRTRLMSMLDVRNLYDLDRLHLTAETTINVSLQSASLSGMIVRGVRSIIFQGPKKKAVTKAMHPHANFGLGEQWRISIDSRRPGEKRPLHRN